MLAGEAWGDGLSMVGVLCEGSGGVRCAQRCQDSHAALRLAQNAQHFICGEDRLNLQHRDMCTTRISIL